MLTNKTSLISLIKRLVSIDTSDPEISNEKLVETIEHFLSAIPSIKVTLVPSRSKISNSIILTVGPEQVPGLILSGHVDVVPARGQTWHADPFVPYIRNGRLYGRGSCDMKSFVGCALALLPVIAGRRLSYPVHLVLTCDEETSVQEAPIVIEKLLSQVAKPFGAIVGEPTMMRICTHHRGVDDKLVTVKGKSCHASQPLHGINAIYIAADLIQRLLACPQGTQKPLSPTTTTNVGIIKGGTSINTVPEECSFNFECRAVNSDENLAVHQKLVTTTEAVKKNNPGAAITIGSICYLPALELKAENLAQKCAHRHLGPVLQAHDPEFPGGTEAGFFSEKGIDTIILGPGNLEQAHQPDEFIELEQIYTCYDFLSSLLCEEIRG